MNKTIGLLLLVLPLCAQAEMYRWVDDNGKVHYGDRPMGTGVKRVPGLYEPKATESLPAPGTKVEDLRKTYGEPDRIQRISTKSGETLIWSYGRSKQVKREFVVKIEAGEVTEVHTDLTTESRAPAVPQASSVEVQAQARARGQAAEDAAYERERQASQAYADDKRQRCQYLRENLQDVESRQRRGGSAATMDSLREQRRQIGDQLSAQGC